VLAHHDDLLSEACSTLLVLGLEFIDGETLRAPLSRSHLSLGAKRSMLAIRSRRRCRRS